MASALHSHEEHFVQLYDEDGLLIESVVEFLQSGMRNGESAGVIATRSHLQALELALGSPFLSETKDSGLIIGLDTKEA